MRIITSILNFFFSTKLTGVLLIIFAIAMATATFIENDFGTQTSKALIYNAKWFEVVILLLGINFIGNIPKYNMFSYQKAPILMLHLAFIVIILGAGITRYRGYEALVTIKEKESTNTILSIDSFLQLQIANEKFQKNYTPKPLLMSKIGFNSINENYQFENQKVNIKLKKYVPNAGYQLLPTQNGSDYLHLVVSKNDQRKDFYIKKKKKSSC